ncbi:Neutral/alkaline nonlysosomal ceramidase [Basidiobolus meristosporus CBS 931.73]|uniref:Neutral ceramidase n=1 Tax=Basidiobolus meristosporus CBS 931.73 TaxID=1314790 RepID=A0A1Y1XUX0_9FUNG|nr:Neutral/alkaline nonlysosomal ceramidase [Basidiobolus meristosporus CBS 931.73]|eukprot:ORX89074.1 Neutral/alkaline nonlysosomal ceramidase [Basidiobolus meristosporus CBS 931.73]
MLQWTIFLVLIALNAVLAADYMIGVGIADITGPAAEINMMGYAKASQKTAGIHLRLRSRAFIVSDPNATENRIAYVSADLGMISQVVRRRVIEALKQLYGDLYNDNNVALTGTHTHSGPGGWHQYVLYQFTNLGFIEDATRPVVNGIVNSIQRAHENMTPGFITTSAGDVENGNINRSPWAYDQNPQSERARYKHNTDQEMRLVKFTNEAGEPLGILNWYAVHCTSMNNENLLISGDNKGYAAYAFEREMNGDDILPGTGKFVAGFAQSNMGDVSPNTQGPRCLDSGLPCDYKTSTCNGKNELCVARGPGYETGGDVESTRIIGSYQYETAKRLMNEAKEYVKGPVDFRHQFVDLTKVEVKLGNSTTKRLCKPAMGYSFAAGTTDGPGEFDFTQGDSNVSHPFWDVVRAFITKPSEELKECQSPKPVLLATGEIKLPYMWQPRVVDIQILRVGQLVIAVVPGEFTTMSGRRLREAIGQVFAETSDLKNPIVVLAGPSNTYSSYVTTPEEYSAQRYEGASTIYGPNTLDGYIQLYKEVAAAMIQGKPVVSLISTPDLTRNAINLQTGVVLDTAPIGKKFGDVLKDAQATYKIGDTVSVAFVGGHPKNKVALEETFLTVEMQTSDDWKVVRNDGDWCTKFQWKRQGIAESNVTIQWQIEPNVKPGIYRIGYFGANKAFGKISSHSGYSSTFQISN